MGIKEQPSVLPSKQRVEEIRQQMKDLGLESMTVEGSMGLPLLGTQQKISYTVKDSVERLSKANPGDVQEIAASQIQLLTGYYDLVLNQARRSFRWALIAAGIGLVFFLASVGFLLIQNLQKIATISLISGALIEVISAINFYLYGKTSTQLATFHTRLDLTQRFLLANSMCESLEGAFKQNARLELIKRIAGVNSAGDINEVAGVHEKEEASK